MSRGLIVLVAAIASQLLSSEALSRPLGRATKMDALDPTRFEFGNSSPGSAARSRATLSGTTLAKSRTTTTWFLYPDACADAANGTWSPTSSEQADSLDSYAVGSTGPYEIVDRTLSEHLWGITDAATAAAQRPSIINGSRSLWCGKHDPNWFEQVGYPNLSYQILYIDTGSHAANNALSFTHDFSTEWDYDFIYLIGGGDGAQDPIGNSRLTLDEIIETEAVGNKQLLVLWTGSIETGDSYDCPFQYFHSVQGDEPACPATASASRSGRR